MTPQELRLSILQRAFQGQLTSQCVEDGTGEELLACIRSKKQALIKAKEIKKDKALPTIEEDDVPFDIPETWTWAYVGDIFMHNTGKAQNSSGSESGVIRKFITTSNLYWNRFDFSKVKEMPFTEQELIRCTVRKGDLLVCEGGDCGRSAIWYYDEEVCIQNHVHRLRPYIGVSIEFFYYLFYLYKFTGKLNGRGVGIQGLSNDAIHKVVCPLPPLAEQKRIVAKIEELLPYIDRYEQAWSRLEDFNRRFPVDMQKSILQMAIQGKLVEQRPEEGTGEELYQQIQQEKQRLIKAGTIKKEKPLPEITEEEIPFDIPEGWKWVRLGILTEMITSGSRDWAQYYSDTGDIFLRMGNLSRSSFNLRLDKIQRVKLPQNAEGKRTSLQAGDLLFSITGEVGSVAQAEYVDGYFDSAAEKALREVESYLRELYSQAYPDLGEPKEISTIKDKLLNDENVYMFDRQTQSGKNYFDGIKSLFDNVFKAYRNPTAHRNIKINKREASERIMLASQLLYVLDERKK